MPEMAQNGLSEPRMTPETSATPLSVKQALLQAVVREQQKTLEPKAYFRMSSIGQCPRAQIGRRAGLVPTHEPKACELKKMWMGTVLGRAIEKALASEGFLVSEYTEKEVVYRSYVGHPDGVTVLLPCGKTVVEFKTSNDDSITKYKWSPHYKWQGFGYCRALSCQHLLLYQLGRSYGLDREEIFPLTDAWKTEIDHHIDTMDTLWLQYEQTKQLPPCDHRFPWENKTCAFLQRVEQQEF